MRNNLISVKEYYHAFFGLLLLYGKKLCFGNVIVALVLHFGTWKQGIRESFLLYVFFLKSCEIHGRMDVSGTLLFSNGFMSFTFTYWFLNVLQQIAVFAHLRHEYLYFSLALKSLSSTLLADMPYDDRSHQEVSAPPSLSGH
ncbi:hypothetical protein L6452_41757 [Arctium lappa]|uniref:Uncharacterized protein n=1 Tax=Arctium lappa TaxID=4217 RepID=A0ACB8XTM6_ARCLA|nr:hypothetical protein L6452_41757 [Arctium lappa]